MHNSAIQRGIIVLLIIILFPVVLLLVVKAQHAGRGLNPSPGDAASNKRQQNSDDVMELSVKAQKKCSAESYFATEKNGGARGLIVWWR